MVEDEIKNGIAFRLKPFMFELNDEYTRNRMVSVVEDYLESVDCYKYHVDFDKLPGDEDSLVVKTYIQRNPGDETFSELTYTFCKGSANFEELVGNANH